MAGLYLVETTAGAVVHFGRIAEGIGLPFRVRPVLPGPTSAGAGASEDDDRVAPLLLRMERTAEALDCSPTTVKRLIRDGRLPAVKVNGATRVRVADLQAYVDALSAGASSGPGRSRVVSPAAHGHAAGDSTPSTKGPEACPSTA